MKLTPDEQKEFRKRLSKAFRTLRKQGYIAKQNFMCCQSCAWSAIGGKPEKVVFYHSQDNDDIEDGYVYLAWRGKPEEIIKALNDAGNLIPSWAAVNNSRIRIYFNRYK